MSLSQELVSLGFDDKKAKLYLALLELGTAKAQSIAKKARLERPTTYDLLAKLIKEGLVSSFEKRGVHYYSAARPEKIKSRFRELERQAELIMPQLNAMYGLSENKPQTRFYEGVEGIKTVFEDTLTAQTKVLNCILSMEDLYTIPGKRFMDSYVEQRIKAGLSICVIRSKSKEVRKEDWPTSNEQKRELRYAPQDMIFSMTTYLYDAKVGLISTQKENFGMIIESKEFYQTMNNLFKSLWQISMQV